MSECVHKNPERKHTTCLCVRARSCISRMCLHACNVCTCECMRLHACLFACMQRACACLRNIQRKICGETAHECRLCLQVTAHARVSMQASPQCELGLLAIQDSHPVPQMLNIGAGYPKVLVWVEGFMAQQHLYKMLH